MTWGFQGNSGGTNTGTQGWGNYLQQQAQQFTPNAPSSPDITTDAWGNKHRTVMNDMLSGQRNQLDDYVKRAGMTGIQRGGFQQQTAAPSAQYDAIKNLAGGYGDRYNQALAYMNQLGEFDQRNYQTQAQTYSDLVGAATQYQSGAEQRELEAYLQQKAGEAAMAQQLAQQQWQTGERTGTQAYQTEQDARQREWQTGERTGTQGWQTAERMGTQQYQSIQNQLAQQQAWNSLMAQLQAQKYATDLGYMGSLAGSIL
jgi:hypothetical protein